MTPDIKRILVPLDFSVNSDRALDYAKGLAQKFDAAVHLIHVCEVPTMASATMEAYSLAYTDWSQRLGEEAEMQLLAHKARITGVTVTTEVLFGNAALAIVDAALSNNIDLIVMGTHGHGPVLHMVMGNVAERVVRHAPCPVLTVREPRERELKRRPSLKLATVVAAFVAGIVMLAPGMVSPAAAQAPASAPAQEEMKQSVPGGEVYRTYCASCHGTAARGDGPLASSMRRKPANLTEIATRNGGQFPSELVFKVIDGRERVRGHGGPDMPVWGDAFARSRDGGDEVRVKAVIKSLVEYLESIQLRPVH